MSVEDVLKEEKLHALEVLDACMTTNPELERAMEVLANHAKAEDSYNIQQARLSLHGQQFAAKAWYEALETLKLSENEKSTLKIKKVSSINNSKMKRTTYIVEYVIPLQDVWPFRVEFYEQGDEVRVLMTKQPKGVVELTLDTDGVFKRLNTGATTYFDIIVETFAAYCADCNRVEEFVENAAWIV